MKLLITGATGFIGTNFILQLHSKYQITAIVREKSNTTTIAPFCSIFSYDGNIQKLIDFCQKEKFDGVIHLATRYQPTHQSDEISEILNANIIFGIELLESLKQTPPFFFINTLTFSQFVNGINFSPSSLYDSTKQAFFDCICFYATQMPTTFTHLLLYNTYGANDPRKKIFNLWKENLSSNAVLKMSLGEQEIDISHIDDIINGFDITIQMLKEKQIANNTIYALQNTRFTLRDLSMIFEEVAQQKLNIEWGSKAYRDNEIMKPIQNPQVPILPNWKPQLSIHEGIRRFLNHSSRGGGINENPLNSIAPYTKVVA